MKSLPLFRTNISRIIFLLAATSQMVLVVSISAAGQTEVLPFKTILKGTDCGINDPMDRVISDDNNWQFFWKQLHSNIRCATDDTLCIPPPPAIDFTKKIVIVSTMGVQPSPGHDITIVKLEAVSSMVFVNILETKPGKVCSPLTVISRPFHIIETDARLFFTFRRSITIPKCAHPSLANEEEE